MGYENEYSSACVIDVETVASPNVEGLLDPIKPPANYKDEFKRLTYVQDKLAERIATASLEPDLCEIVALGFQYEEGHGCSCETRADQSEADLLNWFWDCVGVHRLVGFNILPFDLPVLIRRSQLLNIEYPAVNLDRYRTQHIDLLDRLSFQGRIPFRSLNFYARRFGIDCADTIAGSDIPGLVAAGEWEMVKHHCAADIDKTAKLAARLGWFRLAEAVA